FSGVWLPALSAPPEVCRTFGLRHTTRICLGHVYLRPSTHYSVSARRCHSSVPASRHTRVRESLPVGHPLPLPVSRSVATYPDPISVDQETLVFRWAGFSPALSLLMPTFAFPERPRILTMRIHPRWNAPLPLRYKSESIASVIHLMPVYYPRPAARLVSCYALFK